MGNEVDYTTVGPHDNIAFALHTELSTATLGGKQYGQPEAGG